MTGVGGGGGEVTELKALTAKWCEITPSPGVQYITNKLKLEFDMQTVWTAPP